MKTNLESIIQQTFKGKIFVSAEFSSPQETRYNTNGEQETLPYGEKIINARLGFNDGREDAGLVLIFKNSSFFFYNNENITVKD